MIVPISAQNTIVLMCSTLTPRFGPSCCRIHAPNRNPTAMPIPCGLTAKSPHRWMRSRTGQPIEASTGPSLSAGARSVARPAGPAFALERGGDALAEEQPARHVGRVMHADVHAREADRARHDV